MTIQAGMSYALPRLELPGKRYIERPHPEWTLHQLRWRWLLDSWEGGEVYRMADYGYDPRGMPIRNMIRHKREYPATGDAQYAVQAGRPAGSDPAAQATDDDYELRRARTPVPGFVAEVVETHLGKILKREIEREGPDAIMEWWKDVDGRGTTIDQWMSDTIDPLIMVLGQLDIIVDLPAAPKGREVRSRAEEDELGLTIPVASYILPENMVWWELDRRGRYECCIVREILDDQSVRWRYWDVEQWVVYDDRGTRTGGDVHPYEAVPIVRVFDRRRPRCRNIGLPRYEIVAELQREYYNRDSELVLADTTHAHPLLQAPMEFIQPDGTVPVGPNWLLPMAKNQSGSTVSYQGWEVIEFPTAGADSIRTNKHDIRDSVDRAAALTKPAGVAGTQGQTVSQSGVSKQMDNQTGNDLLAKVAKSLQRCEQAVVDLYWLVAGRGKVDDSGKKATIVKYPSEFNLQTAPELADITAKIQLLLNSAGIAPEIETPLISRTIKEALVGLDDSEYEGMDAGLERLMGEAGPRAAALADAEVSSATATDGGESAAGDS